MCEVMLFIYLLHNTLNNLVTFEFFKNDHIKQSKNTLFVIYIIWLDVEKTLL